MKIGAFARKFDMNISTVRFYINSGLLSPIRENGQYEFDKECVADMEHILRYKKYFFTLEEIQLLFFMEKASRFQDEIVLAVCSDILKNKKTELLNKRDKLTKLIEDIQNEIEALPPAPKNEESECGVPFAFIPFLYCPRCREPLNLEGASLSKGSIQKGNLSCECGYKAEVKQGIIVCNDYNEETPFKAFENIESVMAMKQQFSPIYRMLIAKTYNFMYGRISGKIKEPCYIMTGPFSFNFLLEYIEKLGINNTYIIFDPSIKRIEKIKKYLSVQKYNIVYVVGNPENLPIKDGTMDIFIDDYSTVNSLFTYNKFSTDVISKMLKTGADIVGIFTAYNQAPKSLNNFKNEHPEFISEKMTLQGLKYSWNQENIQWIETKKIGSTNSTEKHFAQNVIGEIIEVHGYHAKKKTKL